MGVHYNRHIETWGFMMIDNMVMQDALVSLMVMVSAADGDMTDRELGVMSQLVSSLPIFAEYEAEDMLQATQSCADYLAREDGLDLLLSRCKELLGAKLCLTGYALACDVAAADGDLHEEELEILQMIRQELNVERLHAAAIEKATAARYIRPQ
jgi:Tellurite resistance protein